MLIPSFQGKTLQSIIQLSRNLENAKMDSLAERDVREARLTRERLEKMSPSAGRRNFAGMLNMMVSDRASHEQPGFVALEAIRKRQKHGYKTAADHNRAYSKFEQAAAEGFNRLHPKSARIGDAAGSLASNDARARGHWPSSEVEGIEANSCLMLQGR
jgi:hypothetical protein